MSWLRALLSAQCNFGAAVRAQIAGDSGRTLITESTLPASIPHHQLEASNLPLPHTPLLLPPSSSRALLDTALRALEPQWEEVAVQAKAAVKVAITKVTWARAAAATVSRTGYDGETMTGK